MSQSGVSSPIVLPSEVYTMLMNDALYAPYVKAGLKIGEIIVKDGEKNAA